MHCHIEPHLLRGMAMVVNETSVPGHFPVPPDFPICANFDALLVQPSTLFPQPPISPSEAEAQKCHNSSCCDSIHSLSCTDCNRDYRFVCCQVEER